MAKYNIINAQSGGRCLNIYGNGVMPSNINLKNVTLWSDTPTNEQRWDVSSLSGDTVIKSVIDTDYGVNKTSTNDCNMQSPGLTVNITLSSISSSMYNIKLKNSNPVLYLTASGNSDGAQVKWAQSTGNFDQCWIFMELTIPTTYTYPTVGRTLSQSYSSGHPAIDVTGGGNISAFADGVVAYTQNSKASWTTTNPNPPYSATSMETLGNCIVINHINPDTSKITGSYARTIYAHLASNPSLKKGDSVSKDQIIGTMGTTGRSDGIHLHFCLAVGNDTDLSPTANPLDWKSISILPTVNPKIYLPDYL